MTHRRGISIRSENAVQLGSDMDGVNMSNPHDCRTAACVALFSKTHSKRMIDINTEVSEVEHTAQHAWFAHTVGKEEFGTGRNKCQATTRGWPRRQLYLCHRFV
eukprot:5619322-Amphidinium_carterae.1